MYAGNLFDISFGLIFKRVIFRDFIIKSEKNGDFFEKNAKKIDLTVDIFCK